jgi:hypothetical protein
LRQWIGLALLAPMLVLAVSASSFVGMRCRMSGLVTTDACGPEGVPVPPGPAQSSVGEPGCCERVVVESIKPLGAAAAAGNDVVHAPTVVVAELALAGPIPSSRVARVAAVGDPPRPSRLSLSLLNRSLLL